MKKYIPHILIALLIITVVMGFPMHVTQANVVTKFLGGLVVDTIWDTLNYVASFVTWLALSITSWFLVITGLLLNVSITTTLHIKDFVDKTEAVYTIWKTIRDISGLFIIFALLYAAIQLILGITKQSFGALIKNIVIAGILINFSFFLTSMAIDASNIVSLAIYNSMIPKAAEQYKNGLRDTQSIVKASAIDSSMGISNIFMNALKIQKNFDPSITNLNPEKTQKSQSPIKTVLTGITGIIIMFTTGLSFLFASLAFIIRLVILIFLLAFSPVWFASAIIPQLSEYAKKWWDILKGQLLFMPIYLLLMYAALSVINSTTVFDYSAAAKMTDVPIEYITFAINAAFMIILLNVPLIAALKFGAGGGVLDSFGKSINAFGTWRKIGGFAGTNTLGRAASTIDKNLSNTKIGNSAPMRSLRSATIGAVASGKYGGSSSWKEYGDTKKDIIKKGNEIDRRNEFNNVLENVRNGSILITDPAFKTAIEKMNTKQRLELGKKNLKDVNIVKYLTDDDFEAIKKSEELSDEDKKDISNVRKAALRDAVNSNQIDIVKHMVENMSGKDLMKIDSATLTNALVIKQLKSSQLKTMEEEGLDSTIKRNIGGQIDALGAANHKAYGFVRNNAAAWI
ncbi:MAG: hypothetical protein WC666_02410 [Candidatus Paceibacterota bacterium]|jgi:hypothetical protein